MQELLQQSVPVGCIGAQTHISEYPDIVALQRRLDMLAETGLPIWITELDIAGLTNKELLAGALDDVMTLFYGHPAVEGVLLWGFHDEHMNQPGFALFQGENYSVLQSIFSCTVMLA